MGKKQKEIFHEYFSSRERAEEALREHATCSGVARVVGCSRNTVLRRFTDLGVTFQRWPDQCPYTHAELQELKLRIGLAGIAKNEDVKIETVMKWFMRREIYAKRTWAKSRPVIPVELSSPETAAATLKSLGNRYKVALTFNLPSAFVSRLYDDYGIADNAKVLHSKHLKEVVARALPDKEVADKLYRKYYSCQALGEAIGGNDRLVAERLTELGVQMRGQRTPLGMSEEEFRHSVETNGIAPTARRCRVSEQTVRKWAKDRNIKTRRRPGGNNNPLGLSGHKRGTILNVDRSRKTEV